MARHETVETLDDITGETGASTVRFGLDGQDYEIDLTPENAEALRQALAPFIEAGRKTRPGKGPKPGRGNGGSRQRAQEIREWARQQGIRIGDRGRIPASVEEAYDAA